MRQNPEIRMAHLPNHIRLLREQRGWTQAELAQRANVSRTAVSAIEQGQMSPSVEAAIRLAQALGRTVEEAFAAPMRDSKQVDRWAWTPPTMSTSTRYWRAQVGGRVIDYPVEATAQGLLPHDGLVDESSESRPTHATGDAHRTLIMACCDPAVSLLLTAYARRSGFRPICLHRTSREALELLRRGVIHLAGVHLARVGDGRGNAELAGAAMGPGHSMLRMVEWEAGVATTKSGPKTGARTSDWSRRSLVRSKLRWIGRAPGSGARDCQDEVLGTRTAPKRIAGSHRGVVEALRGGWAEAGVCLRLVCEEAGIPFVPIRRECYDLCLRDSDLSDPRLAALIETVRSRRYRDLIQSLPGYETSPKLGEIEPIT